MSHITLTKRDKHTDGDLVNCLSFMLVQADEAKFFFCYIKIGIDRRELKYFISFF